jgi:hypothetical protein
MSSMVQVVRRDRRLEHYRTPSPDGWACHVLEAKTALGDAEALTKAVETPEWQQRQMKSGVDA